jgi:hypothetical protein
VVAAEGMSRKSTERRDRPSLKRFGKLGFNHGVLSRVQKIRAPDGLAGKRSSYIFGTISEPLKREETGTCTDRTYTVDAALQITSGHVPN